MQLVLKKKEWLIGIAGAVFIAASISGIAYFTINSAIARFPEVMLSYRGDWAFIGLHALLGAVGLFIFGLNKKRA